MIGRRARDDSQSFEDAWSGRAPRDEQIADLVRVAEQLCEAAVAQPSAEFRETLRGRLMAEATTVLVPTKTVRPAVAPVRHDHPVRRRLAGLTAGVVASAGVVGLVASSASAVPGELLYPVKRTVESVELTLHRGEASRGSFQLAQASERLAEARELSTTDGSQHLVADALDDFASQASAGSDKLFDDFGAGGDESSIRKVNDFVAASSVDLSALSSLVPDSAADSLQAATRAVSDLAVEATALCSSCTTADVQSLVNAVTGLAKTTPVDRAPARSGKDVKEPAGSGTSTSGTSGTSGTTATSAPTPAPSVALPPPTTDAPSLSDVTDPLVGGLLGNQTD